jgi:hypothetical protein
MRIEKEKHGRIDMKFPKAHRALHSNDATVCSSKRDPQGAVQRSSTFCTTLKPCNPVLQPLTTFSSETALHALSLYQARLSLRSPSEMPPITHVISFPDMTACNPVLKPPTACSAARVPQTATLIVRCVCYRTSCNTPRPPNRRLRCPWALPSGQTRPGTIAAAPTSHRSRGAWSLMISRSKTRAGWTARA